MVDGLREGLSNTEIAARLGISPETVKTHIANMLLRLDLADRHELAAWDPETRRPWWQRAVMPPPGRDGARPWPWVALLGGGVLLLALAVIVVGSRGSGVVVTPGPASPSPPVVVDPTASPSPRTCGENWVVDSRTSGDTAAALAEGLHRIQWQSYLPSPSSTVYSLQRVVVSGAWCSPTAAQINLYYQRSDGRQLHVLQMKQPIEVDLFAPDRDISGFIVTGGRHSWHYVVYRRGASEREITITDTSADGVSTQVSLQQGSSEDATIEELRAVARTVPPYEAIAEPTHPPYESSVEAESYTPSPPELCPTGTPAPTFLEAVRQNSIVLADGVILHRSPFELGWEPGRGMLIDLATGDLISYDERGRRTASGLCDEAGTARLRAVIEAPGFRERVRAFLARPVP